MECVFIVFSDDCLEGGDLDNFSESVDSVWENKEDAVARAKELYKGRVQKEKVRK